MGKKLQKIS